MVEKITSTINLKRAQSLLRSMFQYYIKDLLMHSLKDFCISVPILNGLIMRHPLLLLSIRSENLIWQHQLETLPRCVNWLPNTSVFLFLKVSPTLVSEVLLNSTPPSYPSCSFPLLLFGCASLNGISSVNLSFSFP